MSELPAAPVLVRTWFGADAEWATLLEEVRTPSQEGFLSDVVVVDDPAFAGLDAEGLVAAQPGGAIVSFLADETTLTRADHPILAVWVLAREDQDPDEDEQAPFRVVPAELWAVENNINLANMDWDDFAGAVDDDGVLRGFG